MAGPWERYQQPAAQPSIPAGPWQRYATPQAQTATQAAPSPYMTGGLGAAGQFSSGFNEGLANIAGFPVDIVNAGVGAAMGGVNRVLGTDFQPSQEPLMGSTSIRNFLEPTILPESQDPQMQFVRRVGEDVGATAPLALGSMAAAPARAAQIAATEFGLGGASGIGAATAQQMFPGNETAEMVGSLAGLGMGVAGPNMARRVLTPFPSGSTQEAAAQSLQREGVDLTAGQRTGNVPLQYMESELGGSAANAFQERQAEQFTQAALSRAGIGATRASPEVLNDAYQNLGRQFDYYASRTQVPLDEQTGAELGAAVRNYIDIVPESQQAPIVTNLLNDVGAVSGQPGSMMTGEQYKTFRSRIGSAAASTRDPELKSALFDIQNALDNAAERWMAVNDPEMIDAWRQLRSDYKNFLVLERAVSMAGPSAAGGLISPNQLASATKGVAGKRAWAQGLGDFNELARSGVQTMTPLPNSGTAMRLAAQGLPVSVGAALGAGAAGVPGAVAGTVLAPLARSAVGRALLSGPGRSYAGNQRFLPEQLYSGAASNPAMAIGANTDVENKIAQALATGGQIPQNAYGIMRALVAQGQ